MNDFIENYNGNNLNEDMGGFSNGLPQTDNTFTSDVIKSMSPTDNISFGFNPHALESAAIFDSIATHCSGTPFSHLFAGIGNLLSGSYTPGMENIQNSVDNVANFYGCDSVKTFYEPGEPGLQFNGYTQFSFDNWIGGDPAVLANYAKQYGPDFVQNVFSHEMGHHMIDRMGLDCQIPHIANEAASDYLAGVYAGANKIDPEGFKHFLAEQPEDVIDPNTGIRLYPPGHERSDLFMEGYNDAKNYVYSDFQAIVNDPRFSLKDTIEDIASRYNPNDGSQTINPYNVAQNDIHEVFRGKGDISFKGGLGYCGIKCIRESDERKKNVPSSDWSTELG